MDPDVAIKKLKSPRLTRRGAKVAQPTAKPVTKTRAVLSATLVSTKNQGPAMNALQNVQSAHLKKFVSDVKMQKTRLIKILANVKVVLRLIISHHRSTSRRTKPSSTSESYSKKRTNFHKKISKNFKTISQGQATSSRSRKRERSMS